MGHSVICVDNDERKVQALESGDTLIDELHLPELLNRYRNTRVRFMTDLAEATRECQAIFVAVGTPQAENGDADLSYVEAVASEIARSIISYKAIAEKSTVPVYTNEWIRRVVERNGVARDLLDVVSNPEFLREGTAVADFLHPDRIVVGSQTTRAAAVLAAIYAPLTSGSYYTKPGQSRVAARSRHRLRYSILLPSPPKSSSTRRHRRTQPVRSSGHAAPRLYLPQCGQARRLSGARARTLCRYLACPGDLPR